MDATALLIVLLMIAICVVGCAEPTGLFKDDLAFLTRHTDAIELVDLVGQGRIVVVPAYQGRVMTSTCRGLDGRSLGWINPAAIKAGIGTGPINPYGGEERFWFGPEGGQFSVFFKPGDPFDLDHWKVPALIDTEPFPLVELKRDNSDCRQDLVPFTVFTRRPNMAVFHKDAKLTNRAGFTFDIGIDRTVKVLESEQIKELLKLPARDKVSMVGYKTENSITNTGQNTWTEKTGLLSIWLLGMFPHSPNTTVVMPIKPGQENVLGPRVNVYESFNKLDDTRLRVETKAVFYKADGQYRSKIGIDPRRAMPVLGSYDADNNVLTIIRYDQPETPTTKYVKSTWEIQKDPFGGDVVNSYNDGPPAPGKKPLGPFYELETSSPAAELQPGDHIAHVSYTFHLTGPKQSLDYVTRQLLGVSLDQITSALP